MRPAMQTKSHAFLTPLEERSTKERRTCEKHGHGHYNYMDLARDAATRHEPVKTILRTAGMNTRNHQHDHEGSGSGD